MSTNSPSNQNSGENTNNSAPENNGLYLFLIHMGKPFVYGILVIGLFLFGWAFWATEPGSNVKVFGIEFPKKITPEIELKNATNAVSNALSHHRVTFSAVEPCSIYRISASVMQMEINILDQDISIVGYHLVVLEGKKFVEIPIPDMQEEKAAEVHSSYSKLQNVCRNISINNG